MSEISLCMIVKNEEDTLERCLASVKQIVDEIIIVDTGSTDRTKEIAKEFTSDIYDFKWINNFSAARNFAFSKGTKEYLMWMDADDVIEDVTGFLNCKKNMEGEGLDFIIMPYYCAFNNDGSVEHITYRERILRRETGFAWKGKIHEIINAEGKSVIWNVPVLHKKIHTASVRYLEILDALIKAGEVEKYTYFYYANELKTHKRIEESILYFEKFLQSDDHGGDLCLSACVMLHELYCDMKQYVNALKVLADCFPYCHKCSEFLCTLAKFYFVVSENVEESILYYQKALKCEMPNFNLGVVRPSYYYYVPNYELGCVYHALGRFDKSLACLIESARYKPNDVSLQGKIEYARALL